MRSHEQLRRWAAPVGFLLVVTIAVVVIHNGLSNGGPGKGDAPAGVASTTAATTAAATSTAAKKQQSTAATTTTTSSAQYYVIQSGDTFGSIAAHYGMTVSEIEALNPGVSPNSLRVGQKIRIK